MKRAGYILAWVLELSALAGAYAIHYFTRKRMGMARWVVYKNQGWEREYPMELFRWAAVLIIVLLAGLAVRKLAARLKKGRKEKAGWRAWKGRPVLALEGGLTAALAGLYAVYTAVSSTKSMRDYYFLSLLFGIAAAVQIAKAAAVGWNDRDEA